MFELFFGTKPEIVVEVRRSWAEIIIESARDHTAAWVAIMQAFIIAHTIEIIVLAMIIIVLISVFKQMHKGRPSDLSLLQKEQATQISITNNITTTNDQSGGDMENSGNQTNNHTIEPAVLINPPPHLTMETHIPTWLELAELYVLKEKDDDVKYTVMMGYRQSYSSIVVVYASLQKK